MKKFPIFLEKKKDKEIKQSKKKERRTRSNLKQPGKNPDGGGFDRGIRLGIGFSGGGVAFSGGGWFRIRPET